MAKRIRSKRKSSSKSAKKMMALLHNASESIARHNSKNQVVTKHNLTNLAEIMNTIPAPTETTSSYRKTFSSYYSSSKNGKKPIIHTESQIIKSNSEDPFIHVKTTTNNTTEQFNIPKKNTVIHLNNIKSVKKTTKKSIKGKGKGKGKNKE
jgi:hypothetical protein